MVIPHIGVVGKSGTGKTSLVVKLIKKLSEEGYKIATVKHTQGDFSLDSQGTDTYKHSEAGSELVVFATPSETSFIIKNELLLDEALSNIQNFGKYDLVFIEGMKDTDIPKITTDEEVDGDLYFDGDLNSTLTWIKEQIKIYDVLNQLPLVDCCECGYESCSAFAKSVLHGKIEISKCTKYIGKNIELIVNDKKIELSSFPSTLIKNTILGMIKSLKGVEKIDSLEIRFKKFEN